jgi:cyclopropane-fatty-acyl-phospholipid synthase
MWERLLRAPTESDSVMMQKHATTRHYNQDTRFFESILDSSMKYSSGLFQEEGESLDTGIKRMLDLIIEKSATKSSSTVLEIGPGWGSLISRLVEHNLAPDYTGVSPSHVQNDYIQSKFASFNANLLTSTFEESDLSAKAFDSIFSIGSFCHLKDKATSLKKVAELLKGGGRLLVEDTFYLSERHRLACEGKKEAHHVQNTVFGFSEIVSLPTLFQMAADAHLQVEFVLEHSDSYRKTIRHWVSKINSQRFEDEADRERARNLKIALYIGQRGWNETIGNFLISFRRAS